MLVNSGVYSSKKTGIDIPNKWDSHAQMLHVWNIYLYIHQRFLGQM